MSAFARILLLLCVSLTLIAVVAQCNNSLWLVVFSASLAGGAFSAFFSLLIGRVQMVQQILCEALEEIKLTNPLTRKLGHRLRVRLELFSDMGFADTSVPINALGEAISACEKENNDHGFAANPLYAALQKSSLWPTLMSLLFPKNKHD